MKFKKSLMLAAGGVAMLSTSLLSANSVTLNATNTIAGPDGSHLSATFHGNDGDGDTFTAVVDSARYSQLAFNLDYGTALSGGYDVFAYVFNVTAADPTSESLEGFSIALAHQTFGGSMAGAGQTIYTLSDPGVAATFIGMNAAQTKVNWNYGTLALTSEVSLNEHSEVLYFQVPTYYDTTTIQGNLQDSSNAEGTLYTAETAAPPNLVPLPASAGLGFSMLGGFGILGFLRKRFTNKVRIA